MRGDQMRRLCAARSHLLRLSRFPQPAMRSAWKTGIISTSQEVHEPPLLAIQLDKSPLHSLH